MNYYIYTSQDSPNGEGYAPITEDQFYDLMPSNMASNFYPCDAEGNILEEYKKQSNEDNY